ncbi:hypothetical protein ANN_07814, partial [Periplaneta americana]
EPMAIELDPKEVKAHLYRLGYRNISAEQLKEFIKVIRPWNIQSGQQGVKRSDPVKLYHQYQHIWKQQKVPGEDRHSNLRWSIRERMLGEDPHPR